MNRFTGWVGHGFDEIELAARKAASALHIGATAGRLLPDAGGVHYPPYETQQVWNACTGEMIVGFDYGLTGDKCSPAVPYWAARLYDAPNEPLRNVGVTAAAMLRAMKDHGAAPLGVGPDFGPDQDPPALARQLAQKKNVDVVTVWGSGDEVLAAICGALADGLPCGIVIGADSGYQNPVDGFVGQERTAEKADKHAIRIWRYRTVNGRKRFLNPSSWGPTHGINGMVELDESRIAGAEFACWARGVS